MKKQMSKVIPLILILLLVAVASNGCGVKFINSSAATIGATASVYDIGMKTVAELQATGYITADQRVVINDAARIVKRALFVADDALVAYNKAYLEYEKDKNDTTKTNLLKTKIVVKSSLDFVAISWGDLARLVNAIKPGTLPESF